MITLYQIKALYYFADNLFGIMLQIQMNLERLKELEEEGLVSKKKIKKARRNQLILYRLALQLNR